jgi:isoleucyl-tRNA synthetase
MLDAYAAYDFPTVFQTLNHLVTVDLSAFYVDVTKDRMYTLGAASHERRSTQSVMYLMCDGLARLIAPILPVSADALWGHLPGSRAGSVHLELFPTLDSMRDPQLVATWERLMDVRETVNGTLEEQRKHKIIANSLTARVILTAKGSIGVLLDRYRAALPMLFIVSDVALDATEPDAVDEFRVSVQKAGGTKCARCWRIVPDVHTNGAWEGICDRCVTALAPVS